MNKQPAVPKPAAPRAALPFVGVCAALLASAPVFAQFAYIPNGVDRTVTVINTAAGTVVTTISLPESDRFPVGVAVNPSGARVYVTNTCDSGLGAFGTTCWIRDAGSVSVINAASNTVIATIPIPREPVGVAVSPNGSRLYVVNGCGPDCVGSDVQGAVSVIDIAAGSAAENMVIATIPLADEYAIGVAVSPDGSRVYVTHLLDSATETKGMVSVITPRPTASLPASRFCPAPPAWC